MQQRQQRQPPGLTPAAGVPLQAVLAAREFRQVVTTADDQFNRMLKSVSKPLLARLDKHPRSPIRHEQLADARRTWTEQARELPYRIATTSKLGKGLTITETRLVASLWQAPDWQGRWEFGLALTEISLIADKSLRITTKPLIVFSQHALGRRFQRGEDQRHHAVASDMIQTLDASVWYQERDGLVGDVDGGRWIAYPTVAQHDSVGVELFAVRTFYGPAELRVR